MFVITAGDHKITRIPQEPNVVAMTTDNVLNLGLSKAKNLQNLDASGTFSIQTNKATVSWWAPTINATYSPSDQM